MKNVDYSNRRIITTDFIGTSKQTINAPIIVEANKKEIKEPKTRKRSLINRGIRLVGIYGIFCDATNSFYVGQSQNLSGRIKNHKSLLKSNSHAISKMQKDYNMHGNFRFEILEHCEEEYLLVSETYFIDSFKKQGKSTYNTILDTVNKDSIINVPHKFKKVLTRLVGAINDGKISIEQLEYMLDNLG